jgi:UDP-N-acetylglucosamine acyltransferase
MAYTHVAHDCIIGDNVILANLVNMGGHVEIDDWAIVGGMVPIHQFVRIGMHSLIAAGFRTMKDVPPYIISGNLPMQYEGVNIIGLRRRGFTSEQIKKIGDIYHILYKSGLNISDALKKIKNEHEMKDEAKVIIDFIETSSRGIIGGER